MGKTTTSFVLRCAIFGAVVVAIVYGVFGTERALLNPFTLGALGAGALLLIHTAQEQRNRIQRRVVRFGGVVILGLTIWLTLAMMLRA